MGNSNNLCLLPNTYDRAWEVVQAVSSTQDFAFAKHLLGPPLRTTSKVQGSPASTNVAPTIKKSRTHRSSRAHEVFLQTNMFHNPYNFPLGNRCYSRGLNGFQTYPILRWRKKWRQKEEGTKGGRDGWHFSKDLKFKLSEELLLEEAGRGGVVSCGASFLSLHRDIWDWQRMFCSLLWHPASSFGHVCHSTYSWYLKRNTVEWPVLKGQCC